MQTNLQQECENAIDKIDLLELLSQYGHFQVVERDLVGPCPYHEGFLASSSLIVKPQSKTFHCAYGKCDTRGSIIQLISAFEKSDIETACANIIQFSIRKQSLVQDSLPLLKQEHFLEYSQTRLRILKQCPLRYWYEYSKGVRLDRQTVESTIGSLIHSTFQEFFSLPQDSRDQARLFNLFTNRWGKGYGYQEERENWLQRAYFALQNGYDLNVNINPISIDIKSR
jgi:hypothetical protein